MSMEPFTVSVRKWWDEHSLSLRRLLEVFLAFGCGVLNIVSFGSPYWLDLGENSHSGLWQNCTVLKCERLQHPSAAVIGVRAMLCMALMSGLIGWAISMAALIIHKPRFLLSVSLAFGIQAFLWFIGLLVYTKEFNSSHKQGWSYSMGWVGLVTVLISVIYYCIMGIYRLRHPQGSGHSIQQIYAPLTQWDDVSSSESDEGL